MKTPLPVELLEKYLNGNCSARESARVMEWYASFKDQPDYFESLTPAQQQALEDKIYSHIMNNIAVAKTPDAIVQPVERKALWYKIAGAAAIVLITGTLFYKSGHQLKTQQIATADEQNVISITNHSGHIYKSILPDSSVVWVSPDATLKYPKAFAKVSRLVSMTGECFFEVTKNPKRPFIITSRNIITKVWGTSFLVRDNETSHTADVSVVTGKVSVSIKNKSNGNLLTINKDEVILYPKQKVTYLTDLRILRPETPKNNPELNKWKHVDLYFDNKPLKDIVPMLNATYNVHIKVANEKLNHYRLNADFSGLNLPDVLEALSKALNIDYAMKNDIIELNKPVN